MSVAHFEARPWYVGGDGRRPPPSEEGRRRRSFSMVVVREVAGRPGYCSSLLDPTFESVIVAALVPIPPEFGRLHVGGIRHILHQPIPPPPPGSTT